MGMDIIVPIKFVPDLVDELAVDPATGRLDCAFLRRVPGEMDEHALEQAILLKEKHGGTVTVVTVDMGDADDALYTAAAKGADRLVKIVGDGLQEGVSTDAFVELIRPVVEAGPCDLVLTCTQSHDDLDGSYGARLAARVGFPYVGYVTGVTGEEGKVVVRKEYPGGLLAEVESELPAIIGIQAAETPPRYVVTSLVMQAMKTASIEEIEAPPEAVAALEGVRMSVPEKTSHAQMLAGGPAEVADALVALFRERGILA
jgi:electron transfer flavoprotein beta subunit